MKKTDYANREDAAQSIADAIISDLITLLTAQDTVTVAVAGGTTPAPIFDILAQAELDWSRVEVMASDERWVPETHERSNAQMIRARLITGTAAAAKFVPFFAEDLTPEEGAEALSETIKSVDLILLGMGEDMHTASLFPGTEGLDAGLAPDAPAFVVMRPASQPEARISLSARVLNAAKHKHLAIYGNGKADALAKAQELPPKDAPIAAVLSEMHVHWAP
ncbi:6-phosphogluconolactonase [Epibacterium ulvae]|uniref:6-phosphogluconolactonase n=1 Tax=Epibacterium ulvae TaxID=1156985 RepID=UPI001BFC5518|nr:6-phosphogluconolactonase [Epibacterium ulvae]MBT8152417.1 6-phosphogluconolactonase [Epibacterium ulvae]